MELTEKKIAIDFGCMKEVPEDFYTPYFQLAIKENIENPEFFEQKLFELEIIRKDDSPEELKFFKEIFKELLVLFTKPLQIDFFDFSDSQFFTDISELGQKYAKNMQIKKMNAEPRFQTFHLHK